MEITRTSLWTGITRTMSLDVTEAEFLDWRRGTPAQSALPNITASEREFIISGMTDDEWDTVFGGDEPEDEY